MGMDKRRRDRGRIAATSTPSYRREEMKNGNAWANKEDWEYTEDATDYEALMEEVRLVMKANGLPEDLALKDVCDFHGLEDYQKEILHDQLEDANNEERARGNCDENEPMAA